MNSTLSGGERPRGSKNPNGPDTPASNNNNNNNKYKTIITTTTKNELKKTTN